MFDLFLYIVGVVLVLAFVGSSFEVACEIEPVAVLHDVEAINLATLTPAELRGLCWESGIEVESRGRISQSAIDQLTQLLEVSGL